MFEALMAGGVKGLLEGFGTFAKDMRTVITGEISPEKKAEIQSKLLELEFASTKLQTDINLEEAKNPNVFVSGWRPFVGWICGLGLAYATIIQPFMTWWAKLYHPDFLPPAFDATTLMTTLGALLGLGGLRTFEKYSGTEKNR